MSAWTQDEDSRAGTIPDQAVDNLLALWIVAVAFMAASIYIVTPLVSDALKEQDYTRLAALAFPAVGLGLLLWALRRSWRIRKFGGSVLRVNAGAATPGGELAATIHVARPVPGGGPIRLRLRCIQRWRTRRSTSERVLWQQSQNLDKVSSNRDGTDIPVRFHIPADAPTTSEFAGPGEILWRLEARGKSGLVNYFALFEVPVGAATVQETTLETPAPAPLERGVGPDPRAQLREAGITCLPLDGGGLHLHLAAAHRKPTAPTVMGLILTGIGVALVLAPAPGVMRIATITMGSFVSMKLSGHLPTVRATSPDISLFLGSIPIPSGPVPPGRCICLARTCPVCVAQVSKPAVSPTSKSAPRHCGQRVWKPATRQTWKSALR